MGWWVLFAVGIFTVTGLISAEFSWSRLTDDPEGFLREWTEAWIPSLAAFAVALVALEQVKVFRRGQRIQYAPVIRLDLRLETQMFEEDPERGLYAAPLLDDDLDWRREASADEEILYVRIENLQNEPAGSANGLEIDVGLRFPPDPDPFVFTYHGYHIAPSARERHALLDVTGLRWSEIEIISVRFGDDSGASYSRAHGLAELVRNVEGDVAYGYVRIGEGEE